MALIKSYLRMKTGEKDFFFQVCSMILLLWLLPCIVVCIVYYIIIITALRAWVPSDGIARQMSDLNYILAEIKIELYECTNMYCMSKKSWPISYKLLYKMGQYFFDIQYALKKNTVCLKY